MKRAVPTRALILCALFAALTAVLSQIAIPLAPVPLNLAMLAVFLTGALLGPKYAPLAQTVYVLLGAVGVPVFSSFRAGFAQLVGPTGGYLAGYVAAAWLIGLLTQRRCGRLATAAAMTAGLALCYALGTAWFMLSTQTGLIQSLMACVIPFLPGDALKILAAAFLAVPLRRYAPLLPKPAATHPN